MKLSKTAYTLIAGGFLALPSAAFAYNAEPHEILSDIAVHHFNTCATTLGPSSGLKALEGVGKEISDTEPDQESALALIEGSSAEDEVDWRKRVEIWHFYDPTRRLGDLSITKGRAFVRETTLHERFNELEIFTRQKMGIHGIDSAYLYRSLGRMVHYIQDVSVPAHIVPVFHPTPKYGKDKLDGYDIDWDTLYRGEIFKKETTAGVCQNMLEEIRNTRFFNDILNSTAKETQAVIEENISDTLQKKWSELFWSHNPSPACKVYEPRKDCTDKPEQDVSPPLKAPPAFADILTSQEKQKETHEGYCSYTFKKDQNCWGSYGKLGNTFGKADGYCDGHSSFGICFGTWYEIDDNIYQAFAQERQLAAIKATVKAIMLLQRMQTEQ